MQMSVVDLVDIMELEAEKVIGFFDFLIIVDQYDFLYYIQVEFLFEIKLSIEEFEKLD